jgi:hypothetical protein
MHLSPDASRLIVQSYDQRVSMWDGLSGRKISDLGVMNPVESATFSTPSRLLLFRNLGGASLWTHDGEKLVDLGFPDKQELVSSGSVSEIDIQMSQNGERLAGLDGDGMVRILDSSHPPISGDSEALRLQICTANGRATPNFRREDRDAGDAVASYLKGRPWNVCDWRELSEPAGWWQTLRYWGVRSGLAGDYAEN